MAAQDASLYDLVVFGIDPHAANYDAARTRVAEVLGLREEEVDDAMTFGSRVVTAGIPEATAQQHYDALKALGVQCSMRPSQSSGRTLSLVPMSLEREFECPTCAHVHVYQRDDQPPEGCEQCGLVFAKHQKVLAEKVERERMRERLLAEKNARKAMEDEDRAERDAAERRARMEEELRLELGIPKVMASRRGLIATAAGVLTLGIAVGVGATALLEHWHAEGKDTVAKVQQAAPTSAASQLEERDPAMNAHVVMAGIEAKPTQEMSVAGDTANLAPVRATAQGTLDALRSDEAYEQQIAAQSLALFNAGNAPQAARLLAQSGDRSRAIRQVSNAAARRASSGGSATEAAATFNALAGSLEQRTDDDRIGDLAAVARGQIRAGLADAAAAHVEKMREWSVQVKAPDARVVAQGEIGNVLSHLGRQDEAQGSFRNANLGLVQIGDRASRVAVVVRLARSYADAGNSGAALLLVEDATLAAARIGDPAKRIAVLRDIASFHAETGNATAALRVTSTIENAAVRAEMEYNLAQTLIADDHLAAATEVADAITLPDYRSRALGRLAAAQHGSSNRVFRDLAPNTLKLARDELERVPTPDAKAMILSELGRAAAQAGDPATAAAWFTDAERLAGNISAVDVRQSVYAVIAGNMSRADRITDAQRVAALIGDPAAVATVNEDIARVQTSAQLADLTLIASAPAAVPNAGAPAATPTAAAAPNATAQRESSRAARDRAAP